MFKGAITALITPFKDGLVDENSYQNLIEWQIKEGIHGLLACGTSGESPTLDHNEHDKVIELCIEAANKKVPVMAGVGSNNTKESVRLAKNAAKAGADGLLLVTPYYNKPNQEGIYRHFEEVAKVTDLPIYIYNIPGRSVIDIKDETIARIAKLETVVGIKDATGDLARISSLRVALKNADIDPNNFSYLSGEDATALSYNAQGGNGVISVTSNIAPKLVSDVQNLWEKGDYKKAFELHDKLIPLHQTLFCDSNPVPAKYAASLLNLCTSDVRLPLVELSDDKKKLVESAIKIIK